jgi:hypothetical protein
VLFSGRSGSKNYLKIRAIRLELLITIRASTRTSKLGSKRLERRYPAPFRVNKDLFWTDIRRLYINYHIPVVLGYNRGISSNQPGVGLNVGGGCQ